MAKAILPPVAGLLAIGMPTGALAQTSIYELPEKLVDANGVDLAAARFAINFPVIQFGDQVRLKADYVGRFPEAGSAVPSAAYAFDFITRPATGSGDGDIPTQWTPFGQSAYHALSTWETVMPDGRAFSRPAGGTFLTALWSASWQTPGRTSLGLVDDEGNRYETGAWIQNVLTNRAVFADGEIWTIKYQKSAFGSRLRNVVSNRGQIIQFEYQRDTPPTMQWEQEVWKTPLRISGGSLAHHVCVIYENYPPEEQYRQDIAAYIGTLGTLLRYPPE